MTKRMLEPRGLAMSLVLHSIEELVRSKCGGGRASRTVDISPALLAEARERALGQAGRVFVLPEGARMPTEALAAVIRDAGLEELAAHIRETADYRRGGERMTYVRSATAEDTVLFLFVAAPDEARVTGCMRTLRSFDWLLRGFGGWSYSASLRNPNSRAVKLADWLDRVLDRLRVGVAMLPYCLKGWRPMPPEPRGRTEPRSQTAGESRAEPRKGGRPSTAGRWPLLVREKAAAETLQFAEDRPALLMLLDEFGDIIEEFEAWDAEGRPVDLLRCVADSRADRFPNDVPVRGEPDVRAVLNAIQAFRPDAPPVQSAGDSLVELARAAGVR